jgi:hypothetical protein
MKDSTWEKAESLLTLIGVFVIIGVVALLVWGAYTGGKNTGFVSGYCAAIGGTVIVEPEGCNVDGKVVSVMREG